MKQPANCPVCGSNDTHYFLARKNVPVHQNLVVPDEQAAVHVVRGDLDMAACHGCGFVYNDSFDPDKLSYGQEYDNTQAHSGFFVTYMKNLARFLIEDRNVRNCRIIEVGCGKGSFLKMLVEDESLGNTGYGFDPSYVGPLSALNGRLQFKQQFYGPEYADLQADVVVCRHVIEHVQNPVGLLKTVCRTLQGSHQARVFFETPCVEWILKNHVIWDFFYEHCSLFTIDSLATAFNVAGFHVDEVRHVFEDQYLWIEAHVVPNGQSVLARSGDIPSLAAEYSQEERLLKKNWIKRIKGLGEQGKVAIWGAGAKGTTFANLTDPDRHFIDCIIDVNPNKQGHYLPGTGHSIVGLDDLVSRNLKYAILMNPNYRQENQVLLREAGLEITLVE